MRALAARSSGPGAARALCRRSRAGPARSRATAPASSPSSTTARERRPASKPGRGEDADRLAMADQHLCCPGLAAAAQPPGARAASESREGMT